MSPFEMSGKGSKTLTRRHVANCWRHIGRHVADMVKNDVGKKTTFPTRRGHSRHVAKILPTYQHYRSVEKFDIEYDNNRQNGTKDQETQIEKLINKDDEYIVEKNGISVLSSD